MKINETTIPTDLVINLILFLFCLSIETRNKYQVSASWWSGNEKYFCFLFTASRALLQRYTNSIDFYKRNFWHVIPVRIISPWWDKIIVIMMEESNNMFLANGDALVYLAGSMHTQNIPQHLFGAIHLVRTYLWTGFSTTLTLVSICMHLE